MLCYVDSGEEDEEEEDEGMEDADEPMMDMSNEEVGCVTRIHLTLPTASMSIFTRGLGV